MLTVMIIIIILSVILCGMKPRRYLNRVPKGMFGQTMNDKARGSRKLRNEDPQNVSRMGR
jgi:hypothetical protein